MTTASPPTWPQRAELKDLALLLTPHRETAAGNYPLSLLELSSNELINKLDYHGITLLANELSTLPETLAQILAQRKAMMAANEVLKNNALCNLFNVFTDLKLGPAVLFKGSALAYTVYSKPWLRPRSDADIIISYSDRLDYDRALRSMGYQKKFAIEGKHVSYQSTYSMPMAGQSVMHIDLHWQINNRQILAQAFSAQELYENGQDLPEISTNLRIPCAVDSILIACLHRLGHHQREERLAWLYDIHLLLESLDKTQWQSLIDKAVEKSLAALSLDAFKLCQELFESNIPKQYLSDLTLRAQSFEESQIFLRRDLAEWRYFWADIKSMPNWLDKLGLLRESVLPNPDYVRKQMQTQSSVYAYLKRLARGLRRIL